MFLLSSNPIDTSEYLAECANPSAGAVSIFEGRVRNLNDGKAVASLEYEAFTQMAIAEGNRILVEANERFNILHTIAVHRTGHLQLEDVAVWVGVSAMHRRSAFDATHYIIDEIKQRLPIWKKEHYLDGSAEWVLCTECTKQQNNSSKCNT